MITYICMGIIIVFLFLSLLLKAKVCSDSSHFFDSSNTNAMRGFWSIVIILVHIPISYQNKIQDMIGSFAYIGVTFFFMTSAYGVTLLTESNPNSITSFWRRRLPKLLITNWLINIFVMVINTIMFKVKISALSLFQIDSWVLWLICCYFAFWITQKIFFRSRKIGYFVCCLFIMMASLVVYFLSRSGIIIRTTWATECYGFIWGILLYLFRESLLEKIRSKWRVYVISTYLLSLGLGVAYLFFKPVVFWGDYFLKIILGITITSFILVGNSRINIGNKIISFLGKISFEMYLLHGTVIHTVSVLCAGIESGFFILITLLITFILACTVHLLSAKTINYIKNILFK